MTPVRGVDDELGGDVAVLPGLVGRVQVRVTDRALVARRRTACVQHQIAGGRGAPVPDLEQHVLGERADAVRAGRIGGQREDLGHAVRRERA